MKDLLYFAGKIMLSHYWLLLIFSRFAAEIFHDLHEEVMATASRSHGLIVRVQQLEAEFPSIERTLLSQTSHTSFLYNSGRTCSILIFIQLTSNMMKCAFLVTV